MAPSLTASSSLDCPPHPFPAYTRPFLVRHRLLDLRFGVFFNVVHVVFVASMVPIVELRALKEEKLGSTPFDKDQVVVVLEGTITSALSVEGHVFTTRFGMTVDPVDLLVRRLQLVPFVQFLLVDVNLLASPRDFDEIGCFAHGVVVDQ